MPQPNEPRDPTAERLLALNIRLTQTLIESSMIRERLLKAREANTWPAIERRKPRSSKAK